MDAATEARELLRAVKKALPNIDSYLREVLRKEQLTPEAEALRARYEVMISSLEKATNLRHSIAVDPVGLASRQRAMLHRSRTEGEFESRGPLSHHLVTPEQPATIPELSGPLLCRDENLRWHRRFCRLVPSEMSLYIHASDDTMTVLDIISLRKTMSTFGPDDLDKDHCFVIELIRSRNSAVDIDEVPTRFFFAAYTETEFTRWKSTVSRVQGLSHALSSSSIGQDSMFSGGSGERESVLFGEIDRNSFPLPTIPTEGDQDDDNGSDCTIYEDIDELVQQFDLTMKATMDQVQQIRPTKKPKKTKKDHEGNILGKLKDEERAQLQQGEENSGFMYKRTGSGSWKKRWCVLRGCFFTFMKSPGSSKTHEYVLLRADIQIVKDVKKQFVFRLACKGVPEIFLSCDDEDDFREWLSLLVAASKRSDDFNGVVDDRSAEEAQPLPEGIYNVPRSSMDFTFAFPTSPLSEGIYDVPRSLAGSRELLDMTGTEGAGNPLDLYDVPRSVLGPSPEEDAIYDDPLDLDLGDMEIYDYPPDAVELGLVEEESARSDVPNRNSGSNISNDDSSHSQTPASGDSVVSSAGSGSNRHSVVGSFGSIEDIPTTGPIQDGFRSLPLSAGRQMDSFLAGVNTVVSPTIVSSGIPLQNGQMPTSMSFSQYQFKGMLYRKERFHHWSRCFCLIRNSFLECHKSNSSFNNGAKPLMKLFLLGSSVVEATEAKRPFAFQIKHPRREGTLVFAADNENEYRRWMDAFSSATNIAVQQVETVDEMRINDSDLKKKWTSMEKDLSENDGTPSPAHARYVHWKGSSNGNDENRTNSLKRRALKSMSFHRKSGPQSLYETENLPLATSNETVNPSRTDGGINESGYNSMRKSVSLDPIPILSPSLTESGSSENQIQSYSHRTVSPVGIQSFRGYLKVMTKKDDKWSRLWCVLEDHTITCFVSQTKPNVVHQLSLYGSTIVPADEECKRKCSFRVWNSETRQCFFFSAYDGEEYQNWFSEVTRGASIQTPQPGQKGEKSVPVFFFPKDQPQSYRRVSLTRSMTGSMASAEELREGGDSISSSAATHELEPGVVHQGSLKKRSEKREWNDRYCKIKDGHLFMYYQASDETPITVLELGSSTIERVNLPHTELERFTFNLSVASEKTLLLAAPSDHDLLTWIRAIQQCQATKGTATSLAPNGDKRSRGNSWSFRSRPEILVPKSTKSLKRLGQSSPNFTNRPPPSVPGAHSESSQLAEEELVSHIPASSMVHDATTFGFMDIQFGGVGPWMKHWCALYQNCLHIYLNKEANSSLRTIVLQGCQVNSLSASAKKSYSFSLVIPGGRRLHLAAADHVDMHRWFLALDTASRAEVGPKASGSEDGYVSMVPGGLEMPKKELKSQSTGGEMEIKMTPADSVEEKQTKRPLTEKDFKEKQTSIITHYEKKIRKTQRMSKTTHESLTKQMETLRHLKQKFLEHSQKLQKNRKSGDAAGQRRLREMQLKSHQITKILPYLEKYVQVNHQAEMQTLAILREGCAVDLQELETKYRSKAPVTPCTSRKARKERTKSMPSSLVGAPEQFNSLSRVKKSKRTKSHSSLKKAATALPTDSHQIEEDKDQKEAQLGDQPIPEIDSEHTMDSATTLPAVMSTPPPVLLTEPEIPSRSSPIILSSFSVSPQPFQTRESPIPISPLPRSPSPSPTPVLPPFTASVLPVESFSAPSVPPPPPVPAMTTPSPTVPASTMESFAPPSVPPPPPPPPLTAPITTPPSPAAAPLTTPPPPPIAPLTTAPLTTPPPPPIAPLTTAPLTTPPPPSQFHSTRGAPPPLAPPPPAPEEEEQYDPVVIRSPPVTKPKPKRNNPDRHSLQYAELSIVHTNSPPPPVDESMVNYAEVDLAKRRGSRKHPVSSLPRSSPLHQNGMSSVDTNPSHTLSHQHPKTSPYHHHTNNSSAYTSNVATPSNSRNSFDLRDSESKRPVAVNELSNLTKATPSLAERMKAFQQ